MTVATPSPMPPLATSLDVLAIDNQLARLPESYYAKVRPTPLPDPYLVSFNEAAAALIDLDPAAAASPSLVPILSGSQVLERGQPIATVYAGHQFGVFVPQLGDGRAILLAQVRNRRGQLWDVQLKGAGRTPYSRFADGRAVLRSTVREYLAGEAMHHLGIPSTRGLCITGSAQPVMREDEETAAVMTRLAQTHLRFGHFEFFYYRKEPDRLAPLAEHVIDEYFPEFSGAADRYARWLDEVMRRTAQMVSQWMAVGFCHGVMNSDNMSIIGLTLDYGPYGFLDRFDSGHVCNHSDESGRYAYNQQPVIAQWNVSRLLQACLPLLGEDPKAAVEVAQAILDRYPEVYTESMLTQWRAKLGLAQPREGDQELMLSLLRVMQDSGADFTRTFRHLALIRRDASRAPDAVRDEITDVAAFDRWVDDYRARLQGEGVDDDARAAQMNRHNPKYVLRNHLAQQAIERAQKQDYSEIDRLLRLLRRPFDEQPESEAYAAEPPEGQRGLVLSCSS